MIEGAEMSRPRTAVTLCFSACSLFQRTKPRQATRRANWLHSTQVVVMSVADALERLAERGGELWARRRRGWTDERWQCGRGDAR